MKTRQKQISSQCIFPLFFHYLFDIAPIPTGSGRIHDRNHLSGTPVISNDSERNQVLLQKEQLTTFGK